MNTYLLVWNPKLWEWDDMPEDLESLRATGHLDGDWSCGRVKRIKRGDRFFMIRVGLPPKGIMAAGKVLSGPGAHEHWNEGGDETMYVYVRFGFLSPIPLITREELNRSSLQPYKWDAQMSGVRIPARIASALDRLWRRRVGFHGALLPGEISSSMSLPKGITQSVRVDAFERSARVRRACVRHHGDACAACGVSFGAKYGRDGLGQIQVHNLRPLEKLRDGSRIDPARDMIPVCPNCHAFIHLRKPPYTIRQVRQLLAMQEEAE